MAIFTKSAILKSFGELASEKTVDKISVKDITSHCGVSRNTFYYHYKDIYQVLQEFMENKTKEAIQQIENLYVDKDIEQMCLHGLEQIFSDKMLLYHLFKSLGNAEVEKYLEKSMETLFNHLIDILSEDIDIIDEDKQLISSVCQYAITGIVIGILRKDNTDMEYNLSEIFKRASFLFSGAIEVALSRSANRSEIIR